VRHERHPRTPVRTVRPAASLLIALALVVLTAADVLAESWGEVRVVETPTNVRQQRDPKSPVVRTLQPGEKVRVDSVRSSGWGVIYDLNETQRDEAKALGFADVRLLKPADSKAVDAKHVDAKTAEVKPAAAPPAAPPRSLAQAEPAQVRLVEARTEVHKERSLKSAVVAVLAPGERVQSGFLRDGFLAVFRLNDPGTTEATAIGYVPQGMVKSVPTAAAAPAQAAQPAPAKAVEPKPTSHVATAPAAEVKGEVKSGPALLGNQPALSKQAPVRITSDKMVYNQAENSVVFQGNVHGTHTDMAIWAERITAYFSDKKKGKDAKGQDKGPGDFGDAIERIVAEGNVRLVANKNEGACAKLTYLVPEAVIRMDGNPILREGQNTIRGESIKFYIRENRSEVLSGTQRRVEAIFFTPKGEDKN
jgi:lipopolysaccharide export system protein LptA